MEQPNVGCTPVLVVAGPTATGKTALSLAIARQVPAEIVCMDSMQVYRHMDIGTAKPTQEERRQVPHHMLDIVEPVQPFSVAQYVERAEPLLREIWARGRLPMLVGGTGLYLKALLHGLPLGTAPGDVQLRTQYRQTAGEPGGKERLHQMLRQVDPETAARLHPNDCTRVIRALEVFALTGEPISRQATGGEAQERKDFAFSLLGTTMERSKLYQRINLRVERMLAEGLLEEVGRLLYVSSQAQAMQGIGYKELIPVVQGKESLVTAKALIQRNSRRYAKRQWTWFRGEKGMLWLDMESPEAVSQGVEIAQRLWADQCRTRGMNP